MRALSYILVVAGLLLLSLAGYQQHRGVTYDPVMVGSGTVVSGGEISKASSPEGFSRAMTFHWLYAGLILGMGVCLLFMIRRQDRLDPLSPDFDYKDDSET